MSQLKYICEYPGCNDERPHGHCIMEGQPEPKDQAKAFMNEVYRKLHKIESVLEKLDIEIYEEAKEL